MGETAHDVTENRRLGGWPRGVAQFGPHLSLLDYVAQSRACCGDGYKGFAINASQDVSSNYVCI